MYDKSADVLRYFHIEHGVNEDMEKSQKSLDLPPDEMADALKACEDQGMTPEVPEHALGNLPVALAAQAPAAAAAQPLPEPLLPEPLQALLPATPTKQTVATPVAQTPPLAAPPDAATVATPPDAASVALSLDAVTKAGRDAATQRLLLHQLLDTTTLSSKMSSASNGAAAAASRIDPAAKKAKTALDVAFTKATFVGKKLEGMKSNATSTIEQAQTKCNPGDWAVGEVGRLELVNKNISPILLDFQTHVKTTPLTAVQKSVEWLDNLTANLENAASDMGKPLARAHGHASDSPPKAS